MNHKKNRKNETAVKQTVTESLSNLNQPCLCPVFIFYSSAPSYILPFFNSVLLTDRNPQTFHPFSALFLIPDVNQLLQCRRRHSLSLLYEQHAGVAK